MPLRYYWPVALFGVIGIAVKCWAFWGARVRRPAPTEAQLDRDLRDFQP